MHRDDRLTTSETDDELTFDSEGELDEDVDRWSLTLDAVLVGLALVTLVSVIVYAAMH